MRSDVRRLGDVDVAWRNSHNRLDDDLLIIAIEGQPARVADAWQALGSRRHEIAAVAARLVPGT